MTTSETSDFHLAGARRDTGPALSFELPARLKSPARARESLVRLEGRCHPEALARVRLLVTELMSAAIRLADSGTERILVEIAVGEGLLRVEVSAPELPPRALRPTGWGMLLMERLARGWELGDDEHAVWFEVAEPRRSRSRFARNEQPER